VQSTLPAMPQRRTVRAWSRSDSTTCATPSSLWPWMQGATLAEAAGLARHANAGVTATIYAGVSEKAKTQIATKLTAAGFGS
jgi:hypothetical protein